jgi:hypothetical protein
VEVEETYDDCIEDQVEVEETYDDCIEDQVEIEEEKDGPIYVALFGSSSSSNPPQLIVTYYGGWEVHDVILTVDEETKTVRPDEVANYDITVKNAGNIEDTFVLTVEDVDGASLVELDTTEVSLDVGEETTVQLSVMAEEAGTYNVNVRAESTNDVRVPAASDTISITTNVEKASSGGGRGRSGDGVTQGDWDEDGLSYLEELQAGTDPKNPDTDGDGIMDGEDAFPLDPKTEESMIEPTLTESTTIKGEETKMMSTLKGEAEQPLNPIVPGIMVAATLAIISVLLIGYVMLRRRE